MVKMDDRVIPFYLLKAEKAFIIVIILQYLHLCDGSLWFFIAATKGSLLHHHQIECVLHVRTLTKEWLMRSKEGKKEERLAVKMEKLAVKMENWKCREKK